MSVCAARLAPAIAAASLVQSGQAIGEDGMLNPIQKCPLQTPIRPDPLTRRALDQKVICQVMCCCKDYPVLGDAGHNQYQSCADATFKAADTLLGNKSRYKSEVSWDMRQDRGGTPTPFMHRDTSSGENTTEPSRNWLVRANNEIPDFSGGKGMVRRPDITVVDDPCKPPGNGNTEMIYELKFMNDPNRDLADAAYKRIAGHRANYHVLRCPGPTQDDNETACGCNDADRLPEPDPVTSAVVENNESGAAGYFSAVGWSALTAVGAIATAVAAAIPFDGPIGDAVAGSATAAAAARATAAWRALKLAY